VSQNWPCYCERHDIENTSREARFFLFRHYLYDTPIYIIDDINWRLSPLTYQARDIIFPSTRNLQLGGGHKNWSPWPVCCRVVIFLSRILEVDRVGWMEWMASVDRVAVSRTGWVAARIGKKRIAQAEVRTIGSAFNRMRQDGVYKWESDPEKQKVMLQGLSQIYSSAVSPFLTQPLAQPLWTHTFDPNMSMVAAWLRQGRRQLSNGQSGMRTLSIKEGSRASIYTPDR